MARNNALTSVACDRAAPRDRRYGLPDGGWLHLIIMPTGKKSWHVRYRIGGTPRALVLGGFPEISLREARVMAGEIRSQVAKGIDPQAEKKQAADVGSGKDQFRTLAEEWFSLVHSQKVSATHHEVTRMRLDGKILPKLGNCRMQNITPPVVLAHLILIPY